MRRRKKRRIRKFTEIITAIAYMCERAEGEKYLRQNNAVEAAEAFCSSSLKLLSFSTQHDIFLFSHIFSIYFVVAVFSYA
jgi:hypothetical protein